MVPQNVTDSVNAYRESELVKAVSVLTSRTHFGENMTVGRMRSVKEEVGKPVLRKDFIIEPYQVFQARAYGADAILLMANILTPEEMAQLSEIAFELGMDVLFETHGPEEIKELPATARIIGINCRSFKGGLAPSNFTLARLFRQWRLSSKDKSVSLDRFDYIGELPPTVIKVAESGVSAENCVEVFARGFQAILVGTSLLMDRRGIRAALGDFESRLLRKSKTQQPGTHLEAQTA
jgi:indole-3-glycerol phosphate synthase